MANAYVILPDDTGNTGKKAQTVNNTVGGQSVHANCVQLVNASGASLDASGAAGVAVGGNVASGAADSGGPVKVGGVYNTALPTLTNGQRGDVQLDASGRLLVVGSTSAATLSGTSANGSVPISQPGQWSATHAPAVNTQASASKVAGGAGVRHVCASVSGTIGADATGGSPVSVALNLRDGATGAGSVLASWTVSTPGTAGVMTPFNFGPFRVVGSANTAMTLEFAAAGGAHVFESVTLTGYDAS